MQVKIWGDTQLRQNKGSMMDEYCDSVEQLVRAFRSNMDASSQMGAALIAGLQARTPHRSVRRANLLGEDMPTLTC